MKELIQNLLFLFPGKDRLKLVILIGAMIVTAMFEVAGVASIMPFMALVASPDTVMQNPFLLRLSAWFNVQDVRQMQWLTGVLTLMLLFLSNMSALVTNWLLLKFSHSRSHVVSSKLLKHYMAQPYEFFLTHNTSELGKNILSEVQRMTGAVIIPALQLAARLVVAFLMVSLLIALNPEMTLAAVVTVGGLYAAVYLMIRRRLARCGREVLRAESKRYASVTEALAGMKEIMLAGRQGFFEGRFKHASLDHARYTTMAEALGLLPKYVLELIAFGGMVLMALYLLHTQTDSSRILPILALYAFAGYRLMPAMQQIYSSMVQVRYHGAALAMVVHELKTLPATTAPQTSSPLALNASLTLTDIHYAYPNTPPVLHDVTMQVELRTTVGLAGMSGAGKTTLVDIILGLLPPSQGTLSIGDTAITAANRRNWQMHLGYVPQQIYLTDDTIAANIAFGIAPEEIDIARLERAAKRAHLHDFILSLPKGYQSIVGERGIRLSGGQRQRIGIARALYREPSVLILDEATSALDNVTENAVMEAIAEMSGELTIIIIAHRLSTLQACDTIHLMDHGRIIASGNYNELLARSAEFRTLARHTEEVAP